MEEEDEQQDYYLPYKPSTGGFRPPSMSIVTVTPELQVKILLI